MIGPSFEIYGKSIASCEGSGDTGSLSGGSVTATLSRYIHPKLRLKVNKTSDIDVQFEKIRANRIIFRGKDLPTGPDYEYRPRPPNAEIPPISPHEFELAFRPCNSKCLLSAFHDCIEALSGNFAIERIPKRKSALEIKIGSIEFAWGIQAQHTISLVWLVAYHLMIFAGTFGFWGWWQVTHPNDLQNAAVPLSTVAIFLSLFWSSAGVLKIFREPV
jgi:hypothetical protein